jgi:hypothetical protein
LILVRVYYKNNKGNRGATQKHKLSKQQQAGNVLITLIPESNTLPMPDGSVPLLLVELERT